LATISKIVKESPFWFIPILIAIISIIFFIYLPFKIDIFPENIVSKLYYVDNISDAHLKIIQRFNTLYKDRIEVVPVNLPFNNFTTNDRKEILTRSLRSRSGGIDIFAVDLIWIPRFAKWGYTIDKSFLESTLNTVNPMALQACYHQDSLVAFPMFLDLGVLYYRKDLIRRLPNGRELEQKIRQSISWDEFVSMGQLFRNSKNPFYVFTGGEFEGMLCCFHEMLSQEESNRIFQSNEINLVTPPAEKALQRLVDMIYKYKYSPPEVAQFDEFNSYIYTTSRNAVFLRGWIGYHKQYKQFLHDTSIISQMEIAPLPHEKNQTTSGVFGGWSLMISKFSDKKEEAMEFIKFMFQKENQEILYEDGGYLPINTNVYIDSVFIQKHKELPQIQKLLSRGKHRPSLENYTRLSEIISRWFHKALIHEITVHEALQRATKQIKDEKAYER
jgi:multiple sugar transport system substrate-binding protein